MRLASDEREHRRGLVLGLTMAEVLLLLLFLLLLALATRLMQQGREVAKATEVIQTLEPLVKAVTGDQPISPEIVQKVARDLASVPQLQKENEGLRSALADATKRVDGYKPLEARAREINPNDPPAVTLKRGLEQLGNQADRKFADLQKRSELLSQLEKSARAIDPNAPPQTTLESALTSVQAAKRAGADAKMGGQIREQVAVLRETEHQLNDRLKSTFGKKLADWGAELDPDSLTLRFRRPDLLFERGSAELRPGFKAILGELFPEYLRILNGFRDDLEEVRIEGHTSSEWTGASGDLDAYFRNMALSQDRTRAVLEYGLTQTKLSPDMAAWARKLITANGLSSSRPRAQAGVEDQEASRRVEFRVLTRAKEQLLKIVEQPSGR